MKKPREIVMDILKPDRLYSRAEVLTEKSKIIPASPGIYGWYFKSIPLGVSLEGCTRYKDKWLLYIGICPKRLGKEGKPSKRNLRKRIREHYGAKKENNASWSTLRLALGCLLANELNLHLCRIGQPEKFRIHFPAQEEIKLSEWMEKNAFVCWLEHQSPWEIEKEYICKAKPPLNLVDNKDHSLFSELSELRMIMKRTARNLPIIAE